jgi:twitching motility two-component system response regulator PilH
MAQVLRRGRRVLVVDDSAATRKALARLLTADGFEVTVAADGREALRLLRGRHRPRLILLDLSMPGGGGEEFRRRQAQDPALANVPVLVCSAEADAEERAAALGAAGYLPKPVDADLLLNAVRRHCA